MTKNELRRIYKQKRLELTASERMKLDDLLLIQLQRLSFGDHIRVVMSFFPLEKYAEVNTHLFTRYLQFTIPDINVAFPVTDFSTDEISAVLVNDETDFIENKYGIFEPQIGEEVAPDEIDIVFVPLLAFDQNGFRVGYGKGFYDRFLQHCNDEVIKIGFSYFEAADKIEDTHRFDVPLNYCITPRKIYEF